MFGCHPRGARVLPLLLQLGCRQHFSAACVPCLQVEMGLLTEQEAEECITSEFNPGEAGVAACVCVCVCVCVNKKAEAAEAGVKGSWQRKLERQTPSCPYTLLWQTQPASFLMKQLVACDAVFGMRALQCASLFTATTPARAPR